MSQAAPDTRQVPFQLVLSSKAERGVLHVTSDLDVEVVVVGLTVVSGADLTAETQEGYLAVSREEATALIAQLTAGIDGLASMESQVDAASATTTDTEE